MIKSKLGLVRGRLGEIMRCQININQKIIWTQIDPVGKVNWKWVWSNSFCSYKLLFVSNLCQLVDLHEFSNMK